MVPVVSTRIARAHTQLTASCSLANPLIPDYGNEVEVGQGVARAIKEGIVTREDLFLVSKLWNSFHDGDRVEPIARKQLAEELNVHAGPHGSAEQNIALSKAVWQKLAENGGQVLASLRD